MQSIVHACNNGQIEAEVCCVLSNDPKAKGLRFAEAQGIATCTVSHRGFKDRELFDRALLESLDSFAADFIILAGFMRILTPVFIKKFENRILNIHPSLLPKYPGLHTHERALEANEQQHGASVHFVNTELDAGPVIVQGVVEVNKNDDPVSLATRVLAAEHVIYPLAVRWLAAGEISANGKKCFYNSSAVIKPASWYNATLTNPVTS